MSRGELIWRRMNPECFGIGKAYVVRPFRTAKAGSVIITETAYGIKLTGSRRKVSLDTLGTWYAKEFVSDIKYL